MPVIGGDNQRAIDSVMRAIDLVEARMAEDIGAQDMARAAYYSTFYFSRLFVRATGHAPYDYLMRRRVAVAAEQVVASPRSITDIALDFGFDAPETFARAFRRCFGCLPSEARKNGSYSQSIARTQITRPYVEAMLTHDPPVVDAKEVDDVIVEGEWCLGSAALSMRELAEGNVIVIERDDALLPRKILWGSRSTVRESNGRKTPVFPMSATAIAGGERARFRIHALKDLDHILEFAYRAWLPSAGYSLAPPFDLIEAETDGWSLLLPLQLAT
jgi:AraC-like DNA-binding protein